MIALLLPSKGQGSAWLEVQQIWSFLWVLLLFVA